MEPEPTEAATSAAPDKSTVPVPAGPKMPLTTPHPQIPVSPLGEAEETVERHGIEEEKRQDRLV